jgi:hypothetical protein
MAKVIDNCEQCISRHRPQQRRQLVGFPWLEANGTPQQQVKQSQMVSQQCRHQFTIDDWCSWNFCRNQDIFNPMEHSTSAHTSQLCDKQNAFPYSTCWLVQVCAVFIQMRAHSARHCRMSRSFRLCRWRSLSARQHLTQLRSSKTIVDRGAFVGVVCCSQACSWAALQERSGLVADLVAPRSTKTGQNHEDAVYQVYHHPGF